MIAYYAAFTRFGTDVESFLRTELVVINLETA